MIAIIVRFACCVSIDASVKLFSKRERQNNGTSDQDILVELSKSISPYYGLTDDVLSTILLPFSGLIFFYQ